MARVNAVIKLVCTCLVIGFSGPAWPQQPETTKDQAKTTRAAWLHEVYLKDASAYTFFLDEAKTQELKLRREPIMRWSSDGDYNGEVYVWTHQGAATIVGCIFSGPRGTTVRHIMHEFHSLRPPHCTPASADQPAGCLRKPAPVLKQSQTHPSRPRPRHVDSRRCAISPGASPRRSTARTPSGKCAC